MSYQVDAAATPWDVPDDPENEAMANTESPIVKVMGIGKSYRIYANPRDVIYEFLGGRSRSQEHVVLDGISFDVRRGEIIGIIGPNGAGKSTLLKIIAGTLAPSKGIVKVWGRISAILELGTGFNPEYTGRENIIAGGLCMGMSRIEIEGKLPWIVRFSELEYVIDRPFKTYSSGMQARLTFSTAISVEPEVLIIDEALAAGDGFFVYKCLRRIREICESGATVLFVSHGSGLVAQLCHRAIWLENGRIRQIGPARDVTRDYDYDIHARISTGQGQIVELAGDEVAAKNVSREEAAPERAATAAAEADVAANRWSTDAAGSSLPEAQPPGGGCDTPRDVGRAPSAPRPRAVGVAEPCADRAPELPAAESHTKIFRRGPVIVDRVTIGVGDGSSRQVFRTWEPLVVEVAYRTVAEVPSDETLGLAIGIEREHDLVLIAQYSTCNLSGRETGRYDDAPFRLRPGVTGVISATIEENQLLAGDYLLSFGILANRPCNAEFYEYRHRIYKLRIVPIGFPSGAVYYPRVQWQHIRAG